MAAVSLIGSIIVGTTQVFLEPRWSVDAGVWPTLTTVGAALNVGAQVVIIMCAVGACVGFLTLPRVRVRAEVLLLAMPHLIVWFVVAIMLGLKASSELWISWLAMLAVILCLADAHLDRARLFILTRICLRTLVVMSLLSFALHPEWAMAPGADWPGGWAEGEPRFSGLAAQPNMMGWLAAVAFVAEFRRFGYCGVVFSGLALHAILLTGSRSASLGVVVFLFVALLSGFRRGPMFRFGILVLGSVAAFYSVPAVLDTEGSRVSRFNGREGTWQLAVDAFVASPVIGQGPGWSPLGAGEGFYAHNQFLQSLAELGMLGMFAIVFQLVGLSRILSCSGPSSKSWVGAMIALWLSSFLVENLFRIAILNFSMIAIIFLVLVSTLSDRVPRPMESANAESPMVRR